MARKKRVPQLKYTDTQNIGWHVSYRDPDKGTPRRHRFGLVSKEEAEGEYYLWLGDFLKGAIPERDRRGRSHSVNGPDDDTDDVAAEVDPCSLLFVASSYLRYEESRTREEGEPRRAGTISQTLYKERFGYSKEFLGFLNTRHGDGAVAKMQVTDLAMEDIEAFNRVLVEGGHSASMVSKKMQFVHSIIKRAGRPEHGGQTLAWNWDSRDVLHGKQTKGRKLPNLTQLKAILGACAVREKAMVWLAIGCGFGPRDIAALRVGQIDRKHYDLRRGKTGIDRFGDTPPLVWNSVNAYLKSNPRGTGELMFLTRTGHPLVHGNSDAVSQWWTRLRNNLGKDGKDLSGFYVLRHLGATEFGSRSGCSIGEVKRWLGHSASSQVADVYMKPVAPENRAVVEWVRRCLASGKEELERNRKGKKSARRGKSHTKTD